uniref:NodB homology domain-containing protein n=1 Tax=Panagrellus redivivus TaxID=6233 RepID=A0A7E4UM83_PANRE
MVKCLERTLGAICNALTDQCTQGSACLDGICKCLPGFALSNRNRCEPVSAPAPTVVMTFPTLMTTTAPARTTKSVKTLAPLDVRSSNIAGKMKKLGEKCSVGNDLCPQNAHCLMELCVCRPGMLLRDDQCFDGASPLPPPKPYQNPATPKTPTEPVPFPTPAVRLIVRHTLGQTCDDHEDCVNGAVCIDSQCACPASTIERDGRCLKSAFAAGTANPGESCEDGEVCTGGALCDSGMKKCICAAGHEATQGTCIRSGSYAALPGNRCYADQTECVGGSTCINGLCACDSLHHLIDGYCRPLTAPNANVEYLPATGLRFSSNPSPKQKAKRCDPVKCQLPTCFCSLDGRSIPGNLAPQDTPQFIVLSFDDAVNGKTAPDYKYLFEDSRWKNPNGCPIKGTFFVSHEWTNYDEVQWIFRNGHELASNSISHVNLGQASENTWLNEIDGQRRIMAKFGNAREEEIVGMRAPQLAAGGDNQFEMMSRAGFLYDNTISANPGQDFGPFWPQTLDYKLSWPCIDANCPKSAFPGIWEIPMNQYYGVYLNQIRSYKRATMLRAAVDLENTEDDLLDVLVSNFERGYKTNKAPFVLNLNADFLQLGGQNTGMHALERFLEQMSAKKDVYFITMKSLISWMQDPKPLSKIDQFPDLKCPRRMSSHAPTANNTCEKPNKCIFPTPTLSSMEHQFLTCNPCPTMFPWLDNPMGVLDF